VPRRVLTSCALSLRLSFRLPAFEPLPVYVAALLVGGHFPEAVASTAVEHVHRFPHLAAFMDEKLAEQIKQLYPEKNPTVSKELSYLTDNDPFYVSLEEVGEAVSAQELETTIRAALRVLPKSEVQAISDKVLEEA
jgi:hypothetical protein